MIDIIGNIKIDENRPGATADGKVIPHIRVKYFLATLLSFEFLAQSGTQVHLLINEPSFGLGNLLNKLKHETKLNLQLLWPHLHTDYGVCMREMIKNSPNPYYLQFEEDHFCHLDYPQMMEALLEFAQRSSAGVIRSSFFNVETESAKTMKPFASHEAGNVYEMHQENFKAFNHKWPRFYLGTNCIFSKEFAKRFYARPGTRPHDYELAAFTPAFKHNCIIPNYEILRSIDDDHDTPDTCMLKQPTVKFIECMKKADELMKKYYR